MPYYYSIETKQQTTEKQHDKEISIICIQGRVFKRRRSPPRRLERLFKLPPKKRQHYRETVFQLDQPFLILKRPYGAKQRRNTMTKLQAIEMFKAGSSNAAHGDVIARREEWNDFTDMLCRNGDITDKQYNNWSNPY